MWKSAGPAKRFGDPRCFGHLCFEQVKRRLVGKMFIAHGPRHSLMLANSAPARDQGYARSGVIEINVHPSATWRETVETTNAIYDEERLAACKFLKDGRHVGTVGGNHVVAGGATPADSLFLRRPRSPQKPSWIAVPKCRRDYAMSSMSKPRMTRADSNKRDPCGHVGIMFPSRLRYH
jgi:hypothetical protein